MPISRKTALSILVLGRAPRPRRLAFHRLLVALRSTLGRLLHVDPFRLLDTMLFEPVPDLTPYFSCSVATHPKDSIYAVAKADRNGIGQ
jgi:hypothetical protein